MQPSFFSADFLKATNSDPKAPGFVDQRYVSSATAVAPQTADMRGATIATGRRSPAQWVALGLIAFGLFWAARKA